MNEELAYRIKPGDEKILSWLVETLVDLDLNEIAEKSK